jgi:hypothetical protein
MNTFVGRVVALWIFCVLLLLAQGLLTWPA